MGVPTLFIGSSSQGLEVAKAVQFVLADVAVCRLWTQGVFGLGGGTLEGLVTSASDFDFSLLIATPDDFALVADTLRRVPRDNVMFELGRFIGRLGRERAFLLCGDYQQLHLPTDLAGVTVATFSTAKAAGDMLAAISTACYPIQNTIRRLGPIDEQDVQHLRRLLSNDEVAFLQLLHHECNCRFQNLFAKLQARVDSLVGDLDDFAAVTLHLGELGLVRTVGSRLAAITPLGRTFLRRARLDQKYEKLFAQLADIDPDARSSAL